MKTPTGRHRVSSLAVAALLGGAAWAGAQGLPQQMNVAGVLKDSAGLPVASVSKNFTFAFYDGASGGTALWSETVVIALDAQGGYQHALGSQSPFLATFDWNRTLYLGLTVAPDEEMIPRVLLLPAPAALNADRVDGFHAAATPAADVLLALDAAGLIPLAAIPTLTPAIGGTGLTSFAAGDLLYAADATTLARLPVGSAGQVLTAGAGGAPEWTTPGAGVTTFTGLTDTPADFTGSGGFLLRANAGASALEFVDGATLFAGAAHAHAAADVTSGTFAVGRLPTGTSSTTVSLGDHAHAGVYEAANANIQAHVSATSNVHGLTFTAEGAGGGLDADLLDNISSAAFLRADSSTNVATGNTLTMDAGSTLNVAGTWQIGGVAVTSSAAELNLLTGRTGTVWTSANDGAASTLDADLLDGLSSAAFLRADASSNVATGNTLTMDAGSTLDVQGTFKLSGGASGNALQTDGAGNLSWGIGINSDGQIKKGNPVLGGGDNDAGFYSNDNGFWVRFVTNNAPFNWYTDGDYGTTQVMTLETNGDLNVTGNLSKGGGAFLIDHPLDPENRVLRHSFVESPEMMNIYKGRARLTAGSVTITLPEWFDALNHPEGREAALTPVGGWSPLFLDGEIAGNAFTVRTTDAGNAAQEFSWVIYAVRNDAFARANPIVVEEEKGAGNDFAKGRYLHPQAFGIDSAAAAQFAAGGAK